MCSKIVHWIYFSKGDFIFNCQIQIDTVKRYGNTYTQTLYEPSFIYFIYLFIYCPIPTAGEPPITGNDK